MAQQTVLNNDNICDLQGQPLARGPAAFIKAVDKLLTVGAYYSSDHEQYRIVSEKACAQITEAIGRDGMMAIEITASGMMVGTQLVDPHHRNVRLLHDLLVPLNIARFEISAGLTPADLRQAISALQTHKLNLGNTSGFQEIRIENLPETVSTASRSVTRGSAAGPDGNQSLDEIFGSNPSPGDGAPADDPLVSDSEKLAREFMEIVNRILENLEKEHPAVEDGASADHPDSSPENIKALREALRRLVEVNPDPADLARLIEHAKRALDLSRDPGSVDLVFSLLKKEADKGGDWKYKAGEAFRRRPERGYRLSLDDLREEVFRLSRLGEVPAEPGPSARGNLLGICFHLLASDPPEALAEALAQNLDGYLTSPDIAKQDLDLGSAAVATAVLDRNEAAVDRLLPVFTGALGRARPAFLAKFWAGIWVTLDEERRELIWPHLVGDLLAGVEGLPPGTVGELWLMAGSLDPKAALRQVSRLERATAPRKKIPGPGLWKLPPTRTYPVHLALLKSSLGSRHGPRLHDHLVRKPLNGLTEILMKTIDAYDPSNDGFYLSLIKQSRGTSISPDLRLMAVRLIVDGLENLPADQRDGEWALRAIGWVGKLHPPQALPLLARISSERKFIFFKAWPRRCRDLAGKIMAAEKERQSDGT